LVHGGTQLLSDFTVQCRVVCNGSEWCVHCVQVHLLSIRTGQTRSSYVDQYCENQHSVKGRWQLKQLGFGPLEGDEVIFHNIITVSVLTFVDVWLRMLFSRC